MSTHASTDRTVAVRRRSGWPRPTLSSALATAADADVRSASVLAVLTGVFGIVWLIEPGAFGAALGVTVATGWLYVVCAAALLVAVAADRFSTA